MDYSVRRDPSQEGFQAKRKVARDLPQLGRVASEASFARPRYKRHSRDVLDTTNLEVTCSLRAGAREARSARFACHPSQLH
jgi:hypothetical protein